MLVNLPFKSKQEMETPQNFASVFEIKALATGLNIRLVSKNILFKKRKTEANKKWLNNNTMLISAVIVEW